MLALADSFVGNRPKQDVVITMVAPEKLSLLKDKSTEEKDRDGALSVLTNAVVSATGANETQKNEKAAFGAISEALKDDEITRKSKRMAYMDSIRELEKDIRKHRNTIRLMECARISCAIVILLFQAALTVMDFISKEGLTAIARLVGDDGSADFTAMARLRAIRGAINMALIICGTIVLVTGRNVAAMKIKKRCMKRDLVKRKAYLDAIGTMNLLDRSSTSLDPPAYAAAKAPYEYDL
ncbi:NS3/NS3a protein [Acado virus]|nr:NS3/NS3a protein [Acado virus]